MTNFPIYDVSSWYVAGVEPGGEDMKYWLLGAAGETEDRSWLFKHATVKEVPVRMALGGGTRPYQKGEDWVEKVSCELAALIGLPAVRIELAARNGSPGLISRDARPPQWVMHGGGVFISEVDERYRPKTDADPRKNRVGHNLRNISKVLSGMSPPPGYRVPDGAGALDVFAGYLLFDAWIANRDRHEDNWGVLRDPYGDRFLSPSFDHGAALGTGLEDVARARLLESGRIRAWCKAPTAHRFEDGGSTHLTALARQVFALCNPEIVGWWVDNLVQVSGDQVAHILDRIPNLSEVARTFTFEVLRINQERIRDEFADCIG